MMMRIGIGLIIGSGAVLLVMALIVMVQVVIEMFRDEGVVMGVITMMVVAMVVGVMLMMLGAG